jgi:hypothetical protein
MGCEAGDSGRQDQFGRFFVGEPVQVIFGIQGAGFGDGGNRPGGQDRQDQQENQIGVKPIAALEGAHANPLPV